MYWAIWNRNMSDMEYMTLLFHVGDMEVGDMEVGDMKVTNAMWNMSTCIIWNDTLYDNT